MLRTPYPATRLPTRAGRAVGMLSGEGETEFEMLLRCGARPGAGRAGTAVLTDVTLRL